MCYPAPGALSAVTASGPPRRPAGLLSGLRIQQSAGSLTAFEQKAQGRPLWETLPALVGGGFRARGRGCLEATAKGVWRSFV